MNEFTVYQHINKINGKRYIGITQQAPERRWRPDGSGYKENPHFWKAIQKYSWDGFEHIIIKSGISKQEACDLERELIAKYQSNDQNKGYNVSDGGEHNNMPLETRLRLSRERKGKNLGKDNPNYGNHKLAGTNNPLYGKHLSAETKAKISANRKGKGLQKFSEEHKRKIREHHGGGSDKKQVMCIETSVIYESINDAARNLGINKKMISNCCRNMPHFNTAGGYHWQFV